MTLPEDFRPCPACGRLCDGGVCDEHCAHEMDLRKADEVPWCEYGQHEALEVKVVEGTDERICPACEMKTFVCTECHTRVGGDPVFIVDDKTAKISDGMCFNCAVERAR